MKAGEVVAVAGHHDLQRRIMAQQPSDECDRGGNRLEVPRRHGDDEASLAAGAYLGQRMAHRVEVPGQLQRRLSGMKGLEDLH